MLIMLIYDFFDSVTFHMQVRSIVCEKIGEKNVYISIKNNISEIANIHIICREFILSVLFKIYLFDKTILVGYYLYHKNNIFTAL